MLLNLFVSVNLLLSCSSSLAQDSAARMIFVSLGETRTFAAAPATSAPALWAGKTKRLGECPPTQFLVRHEKTWTNGR